MDPDEAAGAVIGRYRLLQKVGEGGMGEVWLAEQKEPVRRRVALKLVKAGMNTREIIARFESERQALALMDHSAIAKVFDAGATPQGEPYFVMEYVAGVAITDYCDNHRLGARDRLELFLRVCEGVQHAHQKAIIHRDLKPSNILVSEIDGRAAPKIIDFGVAKALTQKLTPDTIFTRFGAMVGTPQYMSPEQAHSSGEDIDTRSDVYSLGIILYELLVGAVPFDLKKVAFDEFLRKLREEEPPKPSTRIRSHDQATSTDVAHKRQTEPLALVRQIRGDLDSIALKALEKDRSRRYGSPSDFAADIRRYLHNEPVLAVPPSFGYRARKFGRRYRVALATVCAFALVLIAAAVVSIRQSLRADREAAVSRAVSDFLQNDLLAQANLAMQTGPNTKPDPDLKVRTALDRAAARIGGKFNRQPEVDAAIRDTMGETYRSLGLYPEARKQLELALELRRRALGSSNPKTLETIRHLGLLANNQAKFDESEKLYAEALETGRRALGPRHPDTLAAMTGLANNYYSQGKLPQAVAMHVQALAMIRVVSGPEHPNTLSSMTGLANAYTAQAKYAEAAALYSQVLEARRRNQGPEHPDTLLAMLNLGNVYYATDKYPEAEALLTEALDASRRLLGPEHPNTLNILRNLAGIYYKQGDHARAEALYGQVLEVQRRLLGPEHLSTLNTQLNLSIAYISQGKYAEAEALVRPAVEISRRVLGGEHRYAMALSGVLGEAYYMQGKYAPAEAIMLEALAIERRVLGPEHPITLQSTLDFWSMYQREGKYDLAEKYGSLGLAGYRHAFGSDNVDAIVAMADLSLSYVSQGKFDECLPLAQEALDRETRIQPDNWQRFRAETLLGAGLAGHKKYAEAEPLLVEGYQGMLQRRDHMGIDDIYHLERARDWLVRLYKDWGKPEKAAQWTKR
jgi:tetratricopeptide (TPR) repeat protein